MKSLAVIAGEASGDLHGANLVHSLKRLVPNLKFSGAGGEHMCRAAGDGILQIAAKNATGLTEVLKDLPYYRDLLNQVTHSILTARPDIVVFIDNPAFNLRIAKRLIPHNIPMIYYICPQIWAWAPGRIHLMKRALRKALVVFDFERKIYDQNSVPVSWVGHPLMDAIPRRESLPQKEGNGSPLILLLPGSRLNEVTNLLPVLMNAATRIQRQIPEAKFQLLLASTLPRELIDSIVSRYQVPLEIISQNKYAAMRNADLGLVCSGTATLECALMDLPIIVVYRASFISYVAARLLAKVRFLSLPNLLADKAVVPELLQYAARPDRIALTAMKLLQTPQDLEKIRTEYQSIRQKIGEPGASDRAARHVLEVIGY